MASIQKRADGVWRARYRDEAGREHARHFDRRVDAQRWLDEVTTTIVSGIYVDPKAGQITFERWFADWCALQVWEPGTLEAAERAAKDVPFATVPINKVMPSHVQAWVRAMHKRGLAESTIRMRFNYVHMAFRAAVGERILRDPSRLATRSGVGAGVKLPKPARSTKLPIPTSEQVAAIYAAAPFYFRPFIAVCAFAGLRLGEAAGLQLGDVDFLKRTITVRRQVQGQTTAQTREADPKAQSGRVIAVPDDLLAILSEHVRQVGVMGAEGWLFTPDGGHLYNRNSAGHRWREACKAAGVEGFTLHSCRHFFASGLIAAGCDVVTVQKALGHSTPTITLNTYSHLWPNADDRTRAAASAMAKAVLLADSLRTEGSDMRPRKALQR